jgi:hypothetical protein
MTNRSIVIITQHNAVCEMLKKKALDHNKNLKVCGPVRYVPSQEQGQEHACICACIFLRSTRNAD